MIRTPAQHQTDPDKAPGQVKNDITLGDYIKRKEESMKNKLTFDEWYDKMYKDSIWEKHGQISRKQAENVWFHAQENK